MYHVILAGGSGTRFWPYSRKRKPKQLLKIFSDKSMIQMTLDRILKFSTIEKIYIEQPLHMFMKGKSSAKTLSALMTFNGVVSWLVYEMFEIEPKYLAATSARKHCGIKVKRGEKSKEVVLQHLLDNEPAFKISYTKYGNPKAESYDQADAIVIAKAGDIIEKGIEITEG